MFVICASSLFVHEKRYCGGLKVVEEETIIVALELAQFPVTTLRGPRSGPPSTSALWELRESSVRALCLSLATSEGGGQLWTRPTVALPWRGGKATDDFQSWPLLVTFHQSNAIIYIYADSWRPEALFLKLTYT